jgi:ketosteroid isomerase-like protein
MSEEQNARVAEQLLASIGSGKAPNDIAKLFSADVHFEIAGDVGALPWIGRKVGRTAAAAFIHGLRDLTDPVRFDVQSVLSDQDRAVIVGDLASRVRSTGRIIETAFAIVLTIKDMQITRFQMLEDSFAVSQAARP